MTIEQWASICRKDPAYAAFKYEDLFPPNPASKTTNCFYLGEMLRLPIVRFACGKGHSGPPVDGFGPVPGVRPCCDCGSEKCTSYVAKTDN